MSLKDIPEWITLSPTEWAMYEAVPRQDQACCFEYELARLFKSDCGDKKPWLALSLEEQDEVFTDFLESEPERKYVSHAGIFDDFESVRAAGFELPLDNGERYYQPTDAYSAGHVRIDLFVDLGLPNERLCIDFRRVLNQLRKVWGTDRTENGPKALQFRKKLSLIGRSRLLPILEEAFSSYEEKRMAVAEVLYRGVPLGGKLEEWRKSNEELRSLFLESHPPEID